MNIFSLLLISHFFIWEIFTFSAKWRIKSSLLESRSFLSFWSSIPSSITPQSYISSLSNGIGCHILWLQWQKYPKCTVYSNINVANRHFPLLSHVREHENCFGSMILWFFRIYSWHLLRFIDYIKALTVSITTNRKILKEMGIPASWETLCRSRSDRTGHGTTDWLKIGKGVCLSMHIVTLLI